MLEPGKVFGISIRVEARIEHMKFNKQVYVCLDKEE